MKVWKRMRAWFREMPLCGVLHLNMALTLGVVLASGATAHAEEATVDLGEGVTLELVRIPAGGFLMGSPESEQGREKDEGPQREVTLSKGFWMGKYEVTQEQWAAVMGNNPSSFKGRKNPVEEVSWNDCQEFIRKLNDKVQGEKFRLPTEAEWEYACRAGSTGQYCFVEGADLFGEGEARLGEYAWFAGNSEGASHLSSAGFRNFIAWFAGNSEGASHPVGQKKPNAWGLYDMHGNVWEWCQDWYGPYTSGKQTDPRGADGGSYRVIRGGCWVNNPFYCRSARRSDDTPDYARNGIGFRLAR